VVASSIDQSVELPQPVIKVASAPNQRSICALCISTICSEQSNQFSFNSWNFDCYKSKFTKVLLKRHQILLIKQLSGTEISHSGFESDNSIQLLTHCQESELRQISIKTSNRVTTKSNNQNKKPNKPVNEPKSQFVKRMLHQEQLVVTM